MFSCFRCLLAEVSTVHFPMRQSEQVTSSVARHSRHSENINETLNRRNSDKRTSRFFRDIVWRSRDICVTEFAPATAAAATRDPSTIVRQIFAQIESNDRKIRKGPGPASAAYHCRNLGGQLVQWTRPK